MNIVTKTIRMSDMTSDCWLVQFQGLSACKECEFKRTKDCGGKAILKKIKAGTFPKDGLPDVKGGD